VAESEIEQGSLVTWRMKTCFGVVVAVINGVATVLWDDSDDLTQFVIRDSELENHVLVGKVHRQVTGEIGYVVSQDSNLPSHYNVDFIMDNRPVRKRVQAAEVRPYQEVDVETRLEANDFGGWKQHVLALATRKLRYEHRNNDLVSLGANRVDIKPHQVGVVHRVVTSYPQRFILADEVGLGKTIEAGMILKELRSRNSAKKVLVIVPPNLRRQWQFELKTKFNETFAIFDSETVRYWKKKFGGDINPFLAEDSVLVSSSWITGDPWASQVLEAEWDLVIVDEAHHVRRRKTGDTTQLFTLVHKLLSPEHGLQRAALFLTATPMQLDSHELYSLIELLDPALFPTEEHFEANRDAVVGLNRLVERLRQSSGAGSSNLDEDEIELISEFLEIESVEVAQRLSGGPHEIDRLAEELSDRHLLSQIMIRNRKAVVGGFMPRKATRWEVSLTTEEREALRSVEAYVTEGFNLATQENDTAAGFVMVVFQKLMASSNRALRLSLESRRNRLQSGLTSGLHLRTEDDLENTLDEDREVDDIVGGFGGLLNNEVAQLQGLIDLLGKLQVDSKSAVLVERMADIQSQSAHPKVLIFTEFRETQRFLSELLENSGWSTNLFHGQMKSFEKDAAVERFRDGDGPQVLISTEAGGEGRNFQFCHIIVNYDLPWNPMRVEQRIGRVDRLGQDHEVQIYNLWVKGTIEERVLDVLEKRINVFEQTVGGLDPILGETEKDIKSVLRLGEADRDEAQKLLEQELETKLRDARQAEKQLQDLIMDTKSYRREIAERLAGAVAPVSSETQEQFVIKLLKDVNTYVEPSKSGERDIMFHQPFTVDFPELIHGMDRRSAVFRPEDRPDNEGVEYFALGHPIVDAIVDRVLDESYSGSTGAVCVSAPEIDGGQGWMFLFELQVRGIADREILLPVFVKDTGEINAQSGELILNMACLFEGFSELDVEQHQLFLSASNATDIAREHCHRVAQQVREEEISKSEARIVQERRKIENYFDSRLKAAADKLDSSEATLQKIRLSDDQGQLRIVPVWESNVRRDRELIETLKVDREYRLSQIEARRNSIVDAVLVAGSRVEFATNAQQKEEG
jgi:ATP-dependent helicase HepA